MRKDFFSRCLTGAAAGIAVDYLHLIEKRTGLRIQFSLGLSWEEAFEHRHDNWGEDNHKILKTRELPFLENDVIDKLKKI